MARDPDEPFHEGMALDAVLKRIEAREGALRANVLDPEALLDAAPIDLACDLGGDRYALEHTGIESFPGQIRLNKEAAKLFDPINETFKTLAGADECIQLLVPIDATSGIKTKDVPAVRDALCQWITAKAPHLPHSRYPRYLVPIVEETPTGVPFPVSLHVFDNCGPMGGRFWYQRVTPPVEGGRLDRLKSTRDKKFGKLAAWKNKTGARTLLVLEDTDISLSNESLVAETFAEAEQGRTDAPDEVYVVTSFTTTWYVTCLRRPGHTYHDDGERYWEIDPATLNDLTGR